MNGDLNLLKTTPLTHLELHGCINEYENLGNLEIKWYGRWTFDETGRKRESMGKGRVRPWGSGADIGDVVAMIDVGPADFARS